MNVTSKPLTLGMIVGNRGFFPSHLCDTGRKTMTEEIEVRIRNRKDVPVKVIVKENLYRWSQWRITAATHEYQKQDARTVHFPLVVGEDREAVLRYTVRYTW